MDRIKEENHLIHVDSEATLRVGLRKAKGVILSGGVVAFPTESFYGLAVDATDEEAIQRLFSIKKRKSDHPVLILIPSVEVLTRYVQTIPEVAQRLINEFWPGGITLVFKARANISPMLTAGTGKIGVRLSSHPVATALTKTLGCPITGTSANLSGQPACTNAKDILSSLGNRVDLILDGGETEGGKGSTILDITVTPPRILRHGMVGQDVLRVFISV